MIPTRQLGARCTRWQLAFGVASAALLAWSIPFLLLLSNPLRTDATVALFVTLTAGMAAGVVTSRARLRRYRFVLSALGIDKMGMSPEALAPSALEAFVREPYRLTALWLLPQSVALLLFMSPLRPELMGQTTGTTVGLLGILMLATISLPLHVLIRRDFLEVIEFAPTATMQDLASRAESSGAARRRVLMRLVAAVTTPVVFVTLGSALIVNAQLRHAEETSRKETARLLARAAFELHPGTVDGLKNAIARAQELGFPAQIAAPKARYGVILDRDGVVELTTPLDRGSASVRFSASTVGVLSPALLLVASLATVGAAILAYLLGSLLSTDLYSAARGVRLLGTNPNLAATREAFPGRARMKPVAELFEAIETLAERFSVFSRAQEAAIQARAAATRMRSLFFASVSHDLKSPLNSILGFTQLVSSEPLTQGQKESLQAIHSRAQELLALIETILDAARAEEGQLSLAMDELPFRSLFEGALQKASQLCSGHELLVFEEIDPSIPPLIIDRARVLRAIATLIAYSVRSSQGAKMWIRAERETENRVRIDIDVPQPQHPPVELEAMLSPAPNQDRREHRGLALGLRLARSVVELHHGRVRVVDRGKKGAMFCVTLPTVSVPLPTASAPLHSIPMPSDDQRKSSIPPPASTPVPKPRKR